MGKTIVYGNIKQMRDLQYVFQEIDICAYSQKPEDVLDYVRNGGYAILCRSQEPDISEGLRKSQYCWDDRLIESLNISLSSRAENRKIVIWGTGKVCEQFEKEYGRENIELFGYVDSNKEKWGGERNGLPVLQPSEIRPDKYYVIVATNIENYVGIKQALRQAGFTEEYVYYRWVLDDTAAYFRKTYESNFQFAEIECPNKDRCVRIKSNGDVCTCCMSYESIYGNLFEQEFEEIWNSRRARISRLALENRTFVNCDSSRCPFLANIQPEQIDYGRQAEWEYTENNLDYPDSVAPEVDISCNLYCKSCRNKVYVEDSPFIARYADMVIQKLVPLPSRIWINTVGEPFASKYCKQIIYNERTRKKKKISIYTNGTLLSPETLDELLDMYETIELSISIDAATKGTYEKLRRNGNFEVLCRNLAYISKKREENRVSYLQFNYVLQMDNIEEMKAFVEFAKGLRCDMIGINGLEHWGVMTDLEYKENSIVENGKLKAGMEQYFTDELIFDDNINFLNMANIIGAKSRFMYSI